MISAQVDGAAALSASLDAAAASLSDLTDPGRAAGAVVVKGAQAATPRRTGRLAGSARITADRDTVAVVWGATYAAYVNFGTRVMRARPFATDALEAATDEIIRIYAGAVTDALDTVHT